MRPTAHNMRSHLAFAALATSVLLAMATPASAQLLEAEEPRDYVLTTASETGTYYPVGKALSTLVKIKLTPKHQITLTATTSQGSAENVQRLRNNTAQFAIMEGLYGDWAWQGTGPMGEAGKQTNLRAIAQLWPEVEHWVLRSDLATTGTVDDLLPLTSANTLSLGPRESGTAGSAGLILGGLGLDIDPKPTTTATATATGSPIAGGTPAADAPRPIATPAMKPMETPDPATSTTTEAEDGTDAATEDETAAALPTPTPTPEPVPPFTVAYSSRSQAVTDLLAGSIDGASLSAGLPVGDVKRLFEQAEPKQFTLLGFTEDQLARANDGLRLWSPTIIPAGTYRGQTKAIATIAQPNFMAVNATVGDDVVYEITRSMFENLEFLHAINEATKKMSLNRAVAGLTVPLHPGAIRYYEERGVTIPDHLRPPAPPPEPEPAAEDTPAEAEPEASPAAE